MNAKISVYKQIQQIDSEEAYRNLQDQLIDRYRIFRRGGGLKLPD